MFDNMSNYLETKPAIRDMEAFWNKTEIKIIYFVPLCVIVWLTLTLTFFYLKNMYQKFNIKNLGSGYKPYNQTQSKN